MHFIYDVIGAELSLERRIYTDHKVTCAIIIHICMSTGSAASVRLDHSLDHAYTHTCFTNVLHTSRYSTCEPPHLIIRSSVTKDLVITIHSASVNHHLHRIDAHYPSAIPWLLPYKTQAIPQLHPHFQARTASILDNGIGRPKVPWLVPIHPKRRICSWHVAISRLDLARGGCYFPA